MDEEEKKGVWGRLTDWNRSPIYRHFQKKRLIKQLPNDLEDIKWGAAEELGHIDKSAIPILKNVLKEEDWVLRLGAILALSRIEDISIVPILIESLNDEDEDVAGAASKGLIRCGELAVPKLIESLMCGDLAVRPDTIRILGEIADPLAVPVLVQVLINDNVKNEAAEALETILISCNTSNKIQDIEDKLTEGLVRLRSKCKDKRRVIAVEFQIVELKRNLAAERKNILAGKKDLLLTDKPKPPKRGKMFQQLRMVRNG